MSVAFSDTTNKSGILQIIERNISPGQDAFITGNTFRLAQFTADVNLALDRVLELIFQVGGTWQFDDSNHTDYPIITTAITAGQRDYSFTTDENNHLILDVYKVLIADSNGNFFEIYPVDQQSRAPSGYLDGLNTRGLPSTYDKTANGIFLDPIPNYTRAASLKVLISREGSYFVTTDTTKKAGFAGLFHEYLALRPSYFFCLRNKMFDLATRYEREMLKIESDLMDYYKLREKDVQKTLQPRINCPR